MLEDDLADKIEEIIDERNKILKRKEYLQRKAALRGNKFINDEGNVIVMNRHINRDIRQDLLYYNIVTFRYQEYESEDTEDEYCILKEFPKIEAKIKLKKRGTMNYDYPGQIL
jgi:hypothetical protein